MRFGISATSLMDPKNFLTRLRPVNVCAIVFSLDSRCQREAWGASPNSRIPIATIRTGVGATRLYVIRGEPEPPHFLIVAGARARWPLIPQSAFAEDRCIWCATASFANRGASPRPSPRPYRLEPVFFVGPVEALIIRQERVGPAPRCEGSPGARGSPGTSLS